MPILHVRNVPEDIVRGSATPGREPAALAKCRGHHPARVGCGGSRAYFGDDLTSIRQRRSFNPATAGAPDSTTLLRQDRDR